MHAVSRGLTNRAGLTKFAPNVVRNQKYHPSTFLFVVLFEQFKFFFNLYFLLVALSQFVPALQIGNVIYHRNLVALFIVFRVFLHIHGTISIRVACDHQQRSVG